MAIRATATNTGISVKKFKPIADLVRGRNVEEALEALQFLPSPAAAQLAKVVKSAAANAENNELMDRSTLRIVTVTVDQGTTLRRFRPRARGRVGAFNRPSSHLTVEVDEEVGN